MSLKVGHRTLLAKTCKGCGLLLGSKWFYRQVNARGHAFWSGKCKHCMAIATSRARVERMANGEQHWQKAAQRSSLLTAVRNGEEWKEFDIEIAQREDLTILEKARMCGRTLYSMQTIIRAMDLNKRKLRLNYPTSSEWVIILKDGIHA